MTGKKEQKKEVLSRIRKYFIYSAPVIFWFGYYPVLDLGANDTMNLELSLPLIWLVLFFIVSAPFIRQTLDVFKKKTLILTALFPFYVSLSILWSRNTLRGILTCGILWLLYFTIISIITFFKQLASQDKKEVGTKLLKIFYIASIVFCIISWIQCILDVLGLDRSITSMCLGCVYKMFGFPRANGFMAEPQYLGNILLLPTIMTFYRFAQKRQKKYLALALIFATTIFLTLSRGAIFALIAALFALFVMLLWKRNMKALLFIPLGILSIISSFLIEGTLAVIAPTNDDYVTVFKKNINQLSLGIIKIDEGTDSNNNENNAGQITENKNENPAEDESYFNGYVEESSNVRVNLSKAALAVWNGNPKNKLLGVGVGSACTSIYEYYFEEGNDPEFAKELEKNGSRTPKMNVQNQYTEVLVEFGAIGTILLMVDMFYIARQVLSHKKKDLFISIAIAYGVAFVFLSGLPNVLHLYVLPLLIFLTV